MLNFEECYNARIRREAAYDGRFYTGMRTTGIYCRPVCPVRHAHSKNVEYYPSAAAAEAAGYRPCLRCRPETAPFSPAWKGSLATVERAMRLVNEGALDDAGVEALAARLGIGPRHLSRLFKKHVGASPTQVAQTARVQRAKRMIDNTDLTMTEIALAAGFGSLRRFKQYLPLFTGARRPRSGVQATLQWPPRRETRSFWRCLNLNFRFPHIPVIAGCSGEGPLTEPTAAARAWRRNHSCWQVTIIAHFGPAVG